MLSRKLRSRVSIVCICRSPLVDNGSEERLGKVEISVKTGNGCSAVGIKSLVVELPKSEEVNQQIQDTVRQSEQTYQNAQRSGIQSPVIGPSCYYSASCSVCLELQDQQLGLSSDLAVSFRKLSYRL